MGGENGIERNNGTNTAGNTPAENVDVTATTDQRRALQGETANGATPAPVEGEPKSADGQQPDAVNKPADAQPAPASAAPATQSDAPVATQAESPTEAPVTPETAAKATAGEVASGNPQVTDALIGVYENTPPTLPTGDARYMYIAKGLEKFMTENPESQKSTILQMGYALCLFFGKLGGFSANPDTYSSMVSSIYHEEKMSVDDITKYLDAKSKGPYAKTLMQEAYLKCKEELDKENKKTKKDEDLIEYFKRKLEKIKERLLQKFGMSETDINAINRTQVEQGLALMMTDGNGKNKYTQDLVKNNKNADKDKKDQIVEGILNSDKIDLIDSMLSVEYVKRSLDLPEIKDNDAERLYARFFNSKYHLTGEENKPRLPYFHLKDYVNFIQRAKEKTLAVNTVAFFSPIVDGKSVVMAAVVCPDHKIRYQSREGLHEIDPTTDSAELYKLFQGVFFKGAFEPEESEFNVDIFNQIKAEKEQPAIESTDEAATDGTTSGATPPPAEGEPKSADGQQPDAANNPADAQPATSPDNKQATSPAQAASASASASAPAPDTGTN